MGARERRRMVALIGAVVAIGAVATAGTVYALARDSPHTPIVAFAQPIPADVDVEARAAVAAFMDVFESRRGCIDTADVVLTADVEGGDARYVAADATIEVEIPTTPARFRESLVHELAHHVEHVCPAFGELTAAWLAHTGAEVWAGQRRWEDRPSEQWAEAVVQIVLGERLLHGDEMAIPPDVMSLVERWIGAAGQPR